ncbi:carbon-nitrogen hydrolase family protein [Aureimonas ureilytica]|nr:carbon-nitrogen hydrolase family protein [Aureimonas ureilytica]
MRVSLIQMNSQGDKAANMAAASAFVENAVRTDKPDLVVLPEYWNFLGATPVAMQAAAETIPDGESYRLMADLARRLKVAIHGGSIAEKDGNAFYNTTIVFGPDGGELARYRKIHLFDVETADGIVYRESDSVARGEEVVTYQLGGVTMGCAICYDIRFPELFRKLRDRGADVIVLPAAFTLMTGKDHWEVLARARAIETQTWMLAVGQTGTHAGGQKWCWGHSMAIDPWGHVAAQCSDGVGFTSARLDLAYAAKVRADIPVATHHVLD